GDRNELVLLSAINTKNGFEISHEELINTYSQYFTIVKKYDIKNIKNFKELQKLEEENREGFVVRFKDGFRVKVKFAEYCRLHIILTNVSNLTIWEHLMNNYDFDTLLDRVPDEFFDWLKKTAKIIQMDFYKIEGQALKEFVRIYHINEITDRRSFAAEALKTKYPSILFRLYD